MNEFGDIIRSEENRRIGLDSIISEKFKINGNYKKRETIYKYSIDNEGNLKKRAVYLNGKKYQTHEYSDKYSYTIINENGGLNISIKERYVDNKIIEELQIDESGEILTIYTYNGETTEIEKYLDKKISEKKILEKNFPKQYLYYSGDGIKIKSIVEFLYVKLR